MGTELVVETNPRLFTPEQAALAARSPDRFRSLFAEREAINRLLAAAGLPPYLGPSGGGSLSFRYRGGGQLALHASELAIGRHGEDYVVRPVERYDQVYPSGTAPRFQHLALCHGGLYVPLEFPRVLDGGDALGGRFLGSAIRLKAECEELARLHAFPLVHDPVPEPPAGDPEAAWQATYNADQSAAWAELNDAPYLLTCAKLHYAASYAIRTHGLLMFS